MDLFLRLLRLAATLLLALLLLACPPASPFGAAGEHELLLKIPPPPPAWAELPDLRMDLTWRGPEGRRRSMSATPGAMSRIVVGRGEPQAILAVPVSGGRSFLPAGALYPQAAAGGGPGAGELALDWRGGYAASLALALSGAGLDPWGYDLARLAEGAEARCGDPWILPAAEAARRLAAGEFRIDAFAEPERKPVDLPGPGPWSPESPFAPGVEVGGAGGFVAQLPEGLWRFVGPGEELLVSVDAAGGAAIVRRR